MKANRHSNSFEKIFWAIVLSPIAFIIITVCLCPKEDSKPVYTGKPHCHSFSGYDPSRSASEISSIDYENKVVYYHEPNNGNVKTSTLPQTGSSSVTLRNGDRTIDTGMTSEEIFDQICRDIDFDDFADYYGYYPESY